jgi:hypothetical protein
VPAAVAVASSLGAAEAGPREGERHLISPAPSRRDAIDHHGDDDSFVPADGQGADQVDGDA